MFVKVLIKIKRKSIDTLGTLLICVLLYFVAVAVFCFLEAAVDEFFYSRFSYI